jgi:hypothetical protein
MHVIKVPGQHSEHENKPYCNNPCYSALFGPGGEIYYLKKIFLTQDSERGERVVCVCTC